jgi:hypothetical protein
MEADDGGALPRRRYDMLEREPSFARSGGKRGGRRSVLNVSTQSTRCVPGRPAVRLLDHAKLPKAQEGRHSPQPQCLRAERVLLPNKSLVARWRWALNGTVNTPVTLKIPDRTRPRVRRTVC